MARRHRRGAFAARSLLLGGRPRLHAARPALPPAARLTALAPSDASAALAPAALAAAAHAASLPAAALAARLHGPLLLGRRNWHLRD